MAASANPLATEAGREILRAGGSAVDAAIAIQMVLTLVEPQSSGVGGGAFLMHWDGRKVVAYDGRETAPMAVDEKLFLLPDGKPMAFYDAVASGKSVGTPGAVRMLEIAHKQYGKLPWARLFEPAIKLAESGFPMSERLNMQLGAEKYLKPIPQQQLIFTILMARRRQWALRCAIRSWLRRCARSQQTRTRFTPAIFRPTSSRRCARVQTPGSLHYRISLRTRSSSASPFAPTISSGVCAASHRHHRAASRWHKCSASFHRAISRSCRRSLPAANSSRNPMRFTCLPKPGAWRLPIAACTLLTAISSRSMSPGLLDPAYLKQRAQMISDRSMGVAKPGTPAGNRVAAAEDTSAHKSATSHISVVDSFGNALSMTTTIEDVFGSRIMVRGFLLNNQLTDFSFAPVADGLPIANRVQAGKRPRSSMAPALVFDRASGQLVGTVGSPGGSQIIGYVAKTLVGVLDWNLDVQQAISLPNFGSRNGPTELERGQFSPAMVEALKARGHDVREIDMASGLQGIVRVRLPNGSLGWAGGADPRREGVALGD